MSTYQAVRELESARKDAQTKVDESKAEQDKCWKASQMASRKWQAAANATERLEAELAQIDAALAVLNRPTND